MKRVVTLTSPTPSLPVVLFLDPTVHRATVQMTRLSWIPVPGMYDEIVYVRLDTGTRYV